MIYYNGTGPLRETPKIDLNKIYFFILKIPKPNTIIKLTNKFNKLNIDNLNVQSKCKFLLRCMRGVKKIKKDISIIIHLLNSCSLIIIF
jgi:hypothetical protein